MSQVMKSRQASTALATVEPVSAPALPSRSDDMKIDMHLAEQLAKSELVPKVYQSKPANILIAVGLGRALGLDPVPSLYALHVIEGVPSPSAKTQQALVRRAGHKFRIIESTAERAVAQIERCDDPGHLTTVEFTIDDARLAGYLDRTVTRWTQSSSGKKFPERWVMPADMHQPFTIADLRAAGAPEWVTPAMEVRRRDPWWTNPKGMLVARATTAVVGQACSEVLSGLDFEMSTPDDERDEAVVVAEAVDAVVASLPAIVDTTPEPEPAPVVGDVVDAEIVPEPTPELEPEPEPVAEVLSDAVTIDDLKVTLKAAGVTQRATIDKATALAATASVDAPRSLQEIIDSPVIGDVMNWLGDTAAQAATEPDPFS